MWVIVRAIRRNDGKWFYRWPIVRWSNVFTGARRGTTNRHQVHEVVTGWKYIPIGKYQSRHSFKRWFNPPYK